MERKNTFKCIATLALLAIAGFGCQKKGDDIPAPGKTLYIASGACNSGKGITTFNSQNSSRIVSKVDLSTGVYTFFADLATPYQGGSTLAPETSPQSLVDDGNNILMLTENAVNTGERRIFTVPKVSAYNMSSYANDTLAFTTVSTDVTRALVKDADGTILFSKSVAIEKLGTNTIRVPQAGTNPWINNPGGTCGTTASLISSMVVLPPFAPATTGKVIYAHNAAVAAQNRLSIVSSDGWNSVGSTGCIGGIQVTTPVHNYASNVTGPAITFPVTEGVNVTSMVYIPISAGVGKLITSYSSAINTQTDNSVNQNFAIVAWDVTESSTTVATITNPIILFRDYSLIFGISAMAYDSSTGLLYVATTSQPGVVNQTTAGYGYKIEKFKLDISTPSAPTLSLIQVNSKPYIDRSSLTKCVSSMLVTN